MRPQGANWSHMTCKITHSEGWRFTRYGDALDLTVERVHLTNGYGEVHQWTRATVLLNGIKTTLKAGRSVDAIETVGKAVRFVGEATNNQNVLKLSADIFALGFNNLKRFRDLDARTTD